MKTFIQLFTITVLIFLGYFTFSSLFLFNKDGGGDIMFLFLTYTSITIHFIILLNNLLRRTKRVNALYKIISLAIITFVLVYSQNSYFSLIKKIIF
ncbi:MAG: hypothetical protein BGO87_01690 [Flavobacteriia bacterium 40-80]|nr:MAG: hypothetical protein BGO87_01690 [Flavobacteriia bacterium 40-80]